MYWLRAAVPALLFLAFDSGLTAQLAWTDRQPVPAPPARRQHAMAFTPVANMAVLFGGSGASGLLQDTWEWNGAIWTQHSPMQRPPARQEHAMAAMPNFGAVVLFGGFTGTSVGFLQDTWIWTGSLWAPRTFAPLPPARKGHTLTYDPVSQRVILFGGSDNIGPRSDTWAWTGNGWLQLQPAVSPPPRSGHAAVYDERLGRILIFGGFGANPLADTWTFDGTTWAQLSPATSPSARAYHSMAFDARRQRTVLFGGDSVIPGGTNDETWDFDGTWLLRPIAIRPAGRRDHALVHDEIHGTDVLFGGWTGSPANQLLQDTQTLESTAPATVTPFGQGCFGNSIEPRFLHVFGLPWIGATYEQEVAVVQNQPALVFFGSSRTAWGNLPLPIDLGLLGALNCRVYVSFEVGIPLSPVGNVARVRAPVPLDTRLVGASVYLQAVSADPGANPLGLVVSDAVDVHVGSR